MPARLALTILVLQCCEICVTIKVPVVWDSDNSEVINNDDERFSIEQFKPQELQKPIPVEYFEYTAKKPQFAVDIAAFHGVHTPENHYKARPVRPFTGKEKPELGKHRIQDPNRSVFHNFQKYINKDEPNSHVNPAPTDYNVFHPYKAEEPGLQGLYKDPTLVKIRNDIRDSSQRLQTYENEAGKPDITKDEYLESLDQTDFKKAPQENIPVRYEVHRPQRRPVYYKPLPHHSHRDHVLNQRFRHPWNQNYVKIRPVHYGPLKNHLQRLRQHHALRYGDEQNEYPQIPLSEPYEEPSDGYDIYERGKAKYVNLRNNLDESINNLVTKHRPIVSEKLELQSDEKSDDDIDEEFVPVKNYAQVRKTETTRHLPKEAAYDDAESYEEIKNAPRLREAIKSTKAQTVYTEEGYEDSAYDHAGEQKHASDHEGHGGFLKEKELSGGKYKAPSVSAAYADGGGTAYKDQIIDAKKWHNNNKDNQQEEESDDYSENEGEYSKDVDNFSDGPLESPDIQRNKRQDGSESENIRSIDNDDESEEGENDEEYVSENLNNTNVDDISDSNTDEKSNLENKTYNSLLKNSNGSMKGVDEISLHDVNKREIKFKIPGININSTFLNEKDILEIAKEKIIQKEDLKDKYPYYFKSLSTISKDSPLRYAENLELMPRKSNGGTEFYDSRSQFECPEVDDKVDALPEKFKKDGHPDENEDGSVKENNDKGEHNEEKPRLQGLGDKIDCFKAKYFGKNPLDSPFFKEDIILNPEPVTVPNSPLFKLKDTKTVSLLNSASDNIVVQSEKISNETGGDLHTLLDKLKNKQTNLKESLNSEQQKLLEKFKAPSILPQSSTLNDNLDAYTNILQSIQSKLDAPSYTNKNMSENLLLNRESISKTPENNTYKYFLNKEDITKAPIQLRRKRATPFVYEPYKIIRDVQTSDSKKTTTTTGNVSPLIKQLQTSKVIDIVKSNNEKEQPVKRNVRIKSYKDIGKKDREQQNDSSSPTFVDVSIDKRRGEPRYELRPSNHKAEYTPVENKKSMSIKDYEIHTKNLGKDENNDKKRPSARTLFNLANNFQKSEELQNLVTASSTKKSVTTSPLSVDKKHVQNDESDEDYEEEYDEDDESEEDISTTSTTTTTTTTTTPKPVFRRRIRSTTSKPTTTEKPNEVITEEPPKLRLVTRFRNTPSRGNLRHSPKIIEKNSKKYDESTDTDLPKYREKKKKSSKSTIVTDTKRYGDDDDDMRKEEIDALIGVKQDMKDYMPQYEQETKKGTIIKNNESSEEEEENSDESYEDDEEDDDDDEEIEDEEDAEESEPEKGHEVSTKQPPRRSLVRTTDAPPSTTEARSAKIEVKPVVSRKKYEVHKESPVNKSAPHVTQFKQDIEEVEIIKEIPRKAHDTKQNKNLEVLDLYKDDNLASDVNKLGAVEVFKENLDLKNGPRTGGNYRYAPREEIVSELVLTTSVKPPKDTETSQSENKKLIELEQSEAPVRMHGGNLKSLSETRRSSGSRRNAKLIELSDEKEDGAKSLHGGNLKSLNERSRNRSRGRSEKLIELNDGDEDDDSDSTDQMHGGNFRSYDGTRNSRRGLHGGNYRSSKLVQADNVDDESAKLENVKGEKKDIRNPADLLNSFAQAIPILTTTPAYILDPSKRMYYYVD